MKRFFEHFHFRPVIYSRLCLVWVAMISLASSIPNLQIDKTVPQSDKFVHIVIFAVLAYLLYGALRDHLRDYVPVAQIAVVIIMCAAIGLLDEAHQLVVAGRTFSLWDWIADLIGCVCGAVLYRSFHQT